MRVRTHSHNKVLKSFFLLALLGWCSGPLFGEDVFAYPQNRLGCSDSLGRVSVWVNNRWGVWVTENEWLPIRFQFCSAQDRVAEGMLGSGWWLPCMESACHQVDEQTVRVLLLGGKSVYLKKGGEHYNSKSGWKGKTLGDRFALESPDGWSFEYKKGRISSAKSPHSGNLKWLYSNGTATKLLLGGKEIVTASLGDSGRVQKLSFDGGGHIEFEYQDYPHTSTSLGGISNLEKSLSKIKSQGAGEKKGDFCFDVSLKTIETPTQGPTYNYILDLGLIDSVNRISWLPDGSIVSDTVGNYERRTLGEEFLIKRTKPDGTFQTYSWNRANFVETRVGSKGDKSILQLTPRGIDGKGFKVRKRIFYDSDGNKTTIQNSFDDNGNLVRALNMEGEGDQTWIISKWSKYIHQPVWLKFSGRNPQFIIANLN